VFYQKFIFKGLHKLEKDLKEIMEQELRRMRQHIASEEEKAYFKLVDKGREYKEVIHGPFYKPSSYVESSNGP
jgi:hypothetical protein